MNRLGLRYRQLITLTALAILAPAVSAQEPVATPQREHTVKRGDTLWDLAGSYLSNPFLWPMIYEANRSVVEDPHWIYPGERLVIPGMMVPATGVLGEPVVETPAAMQPTAVDTPAAQLSTVDLRRPVIPIAEYYGTPWLSATPEQPVIGRVVRIWDPSASDDKIPATLHPNYRVHLGQLAGARPAVGDTLVSVRVGREVKGWGRVVEPLALLRVDSLNQTTIAATVVRQIDEARVGDRVIPLGSMPEIPRGRPESLEGGAAGTLLTFAQLQDLYGTGEHAFISLGADQVRIGDEIAVYVAGRRIDQERPDVLPPTEVARALVVRTEGRTATVRLTRVVDTTLREGMAIKVVGRTP